MTTPETGPPPEGPESRRAPLSDQLVTLLDFIAGAVDGIEPQPVYEGEGTHMRDKLLPDGSTAECIHTRVYDPDVPDKHEIQRTTPERHDSVTIHDDQTYSYYQLLGKTIRTARCLSAETAAANPHFVDSVNEIMKAIASSPGAAS